MCGSPHRGYPTVTLIIYERLGAIRTGEEFVVSVDSELEKEIMIYLPAVVGWIEREEDITEADVKNLRDLMPDHLEFGKKVSFEEVISMNKRFIDDPTWGKYITVILSDKGKLWMQRNLNILKKLA